MNSFLEATLQIAGWKTEPHRLNEQVTFTDSRINRAGAPWLRIEGRFRRLSN